MAKKIASGNWSFDDSVASRFSLIARNEIPDYERVIDKCVELGTAHFPERNARVIDIGSATGYTMRRFLEAGFTDVWGVDNSSAMLAQSCVQLNLIHSDTFPADRGPYDLALANWTLHFIHERAAYIKKIYDALTDQGVLVITDKVLSSPKVFDRYHDFKRTNHVSEEHIRTKTKSLEGVLIPYPITWYLETLAHTGFRQVEIINASWGFVTFLCWKVTP